VTELQPWSTTAKPRRDIADGSFDESLFAADLGLVDRGRGPADYLDSVTFCEKTYLTENLRTFLGELSSRLSGDMSSAAVYRLQTEFGGGKTHTLLAAYHLFRDPERVVHTAFVNELADAVGRTTFTKANVVVLEGGALTAGEPDPTITDAEVRTLLGQLAYRLGGTAAFATVADQDRHLRGSSTIQIADLLEAHAPCVILLDEVLQYLAKALNVPSHDGNLAATTLTTIKELCSAVSSVPQAAVVATLTSSNLEDYASVAGEEMQERLSKVVGRTENIVTPVEGDDIFPILHRRLFTSLGSEAKRRAIANAYADWYESLGDAVPTSYREASYRDRLAVAFPFHPELVDILTNRWGSLSGFQRTRGALRTLAHTVKALSQRQHAAALIHPGDVALGDPGIRGEVIRFAGESYKAALNADIIRADSKASEEDHRRGGQVEALGLATGLATTAFLNSFGSDRVLGASAAQMLLGVGRPDLSRGLIEDVRDALEGSLWYMRLEGGRYRFTTEPNLNKVVLEREGAIGEDRIDTLLHEAINSIAPNNESRHPPTYSIANNSSSA
jgi:predicted AAA+ superfamily ATPase